MIREALDSAINAVAPGWALKRYAAREQLRRAYDGAKGDRTTSDSKPQNQAADLELQDADSIRARARDMVRNNAYAKGIINARRRNIVGCGIYPQARSFNERFNTAAEKLFDRWQRQCDVTGRLSFYELQGLCQTEMDEAGECLVQFVRLDDPSRPLPLALELIEADRLISDSLYSRRNASATGNEIRRGVEVDRYCRPVAYHIWERNPNDLNSMRQVARRIPADQCLHLFRQERIDQTRGVSLFAPVVRWLMHLGKYMEAEAVAKRIGACFGVAIETLAAGADGSVMPPSDADTTDENGNTFDHLEPGIVSRLFPGEKISMINPGRGEAGAQVWINLMLRSMAVGSGLSYERLTRDYSQTNYSSNRAADLEDRRDFRPLQELLIRQLCEPVWRKFLASAVDEGGFTSFPNQVAFIGRYWDYAEHVWQAPGWEWVDPVKEVSADVMAAEKCLDTYADLCGKRGKDWRDVMLQRKAEQDFADEIGLRISSENVIPLAAAVVEAEEAAAQQEKEAADADEPAYA